MRRLTVSVLLLLVWRPIRTDAITAFSVTSILRGGGGTLSDSPYELNPDYAFSKPQRRTMQLRDLDDQGNFVDPSFYIETQTFSVLSQSAKRPKSMVLRLGHRLQNLYKVNGAAVANTALACIAVFLAWQIPSWQTLMADYFVCNWRNMRVPQGLSVLLNAISHTGLVHLSLNLLALLTLSPSVRHVLHHASLHWPMWPLLMGAAVAGSSTFLLLDRRHEGCMGLSGVTLAVLAVYARLLPNEMLGILVGILPVRVPAAQLLRLLLAMSVLGTLQSRSASSLTSNVAHATHLGGLLFGLVYYELWSRRHQLRIGTVRAKERLRKVIDGA